MAGEGGQWLLVRNDRGEELLGLLGEEVALQAPGSRGKRAGAVRGFMANVARAAGGLPLRAMPDWLRPVVGWLMPRIGPRGLEFARTRVEMKAAETILHLRREKPRRMEADGPRPCLGVDGALRADAAARRKLARSREGVFLLLPLGEGRG